MTASPWPEWRMLGKMRYEGKVAKYGVINRLGRPVLQTSGDIRGKYKDLLVPSTFNHAAMEAEILQREGQPKGAAASAERLSRPPQAKETWRLALPLLLTSPPTLPWGPPNPLPRRMINGGCSEDKNKMEARATRTGGTGESTRGQPLEDGHPPQGLQQRPHQRRP